MHALGMLSNLRGGARCRSPSHEHHEEVRGLLENEWTQALRSSGVSYRCLLVDGNPVLALMHVAEEQDAGLNSRRNPWCGWVSRAATRSTSHQLLQHARVPVVAVPHQ